MKFDFDLTTEQFEAIFCAFSASKTAYEAFQQSGKKPDDADAVDRHALYEAGNALHKIGGMKAMTAAYESFYPDDEDRCRQAGYDLHVLWDGVGDWRR